MPRREANCNIPLRWQVFGGAISIVIFMHLAQLATEALIGEHVPQRTEGIQQGGDKNDASQTLFNDDNNSHDDDERLPSMHLLMEPLFSNSAAAPRPEPIAINVTMTLRAESGRFAPGRPLLTLPLVISSTVPSARYDDETNPLSAYDGRGQPVPLSYRDEDPVTGPRVWYMGRGGDEESFCLGDADADAEDTRDVGQQGLLVVSFTAPYRKTDKTTRAGARVDLRRDVSGGGLTGQGISFLPTPPPPPSASSHVDGDGEDETIDVVAAIKKEGGRGGRREENWNVTLEWALDGAPAGTHGAWSFGDADTVNAIGPLGDLIHGAVFAVGYLQRFPDWDVQLDLSDAVAVPTYWFDPSPYNMTALATQALVSYTHIAAYFSSLNAQSDPAPFRVFVRHIEANWGGSSAARGFLLEVSDETPAYADALSLAELLAHETVHEFAGLDPDPDGDPSWQEDEGTWYVEGVASYVGTLVGLGGGDNDNHGQKRKDRLLRVLNNNMQAYYTAPRWVLHMNYGDVLANYWRLGIDVTRVSYARGFVFLAQLDGLVGAATGGAQSLDDVVRELYKRCEGEGAGEGQKKSCTIRDLSGLVSDRIGRAAFDAAYAAFFRGDLLVPGEDGLRGRYGLKLAPMRGWRRFELGFDAESLRGAARVVTGLVAGSNAERAGARPGDEIVSAYMLWTVEDSLDGMMRMTVRRMKGEGEEVEEQELEWVPRSDEVVEAYGWVGVDGGDSDEL